MATCFALQGHKCRNFANTLALLGNKHGVDVFLYGGRHQGREGGGGLCAATHGTAGTVGAGAYMRSLYMTLQKLGMCARTCNNALLAAAAPIMCVRHLHLQTSVAHHRQP